jgi:hypothetical protein
MTADALDLKRRAARGRLGRRSGHVHIHGFLHDASGGVGRAASSIAMIIRLFDSHPQTP